MKESYDKEVAIHIDPELCIAVREDCSKALTGAYTGRVLSLVKIVVQCADAVPLSGKQHIINRYSEIYYDTAWSETPGTYRNTSYGNRETLYLPLWNEGSHCESKGVRQ